MLCSKMLDEFRFIQLFFSFKKSLENNLLKRTINAKQ